MRPIINFSVIALAAVSIILSACSGARAQDQTFIGGSATLGEGEIHTWTQLDPDGNPLSIGVTFSEGMLSGLHSYDQAFSLRIHGRAGGLRASLS